MMQDIGNAQEAIKLYNQVIALAKDDCALSSKAQFFVGELYERLGRKAEALRAFKMVTPCSNQTKWAQHAKAKIDAAIGNSNPKPRIEIKQSGPSADGLYLHSFTFPKSYGVSPQVFDPVTHRVYFLTSFYGLTRSTTESKTAGGEDFHYAQGPSTMVVIDTESNAVIEQIPFAVHISFLAFNPVNNKLYATDGERHIVEIIDAKTYSRTRITFPPPALPNEVAVNTVTNKIYLTCQGYETDGNDKLFVIDGATNAVAGPFDLKGLAGGIKINTNTNRIYVMAGDKTRVFDGSDNSTIVDLPDTRILAVDSKHNQLIANVGKVEGNGAIEALDGATHNVIATFELKSGGEIAAIDRDADRVYISERHQILVIDTATNTELLRFPVGDLGTLTVGGATGRLYIGSQTSGGSTVGVIARESLGDETPEEFIDEFDSFTLDPAWITMKGRGNYSLTENPGYLRYHIGPTPVSPRFILWRRFRGDHWIFETKVFYNTGATGGARDFRIGIGFGELPIDDTGALNSQISFTRHRDSWNDCCPGNVGIAIRDNGIGLPSVNLPPNASESYSWRVIRNGRKITIESSEDGVNFTFVTEHTFIADIDGVIQYLGLTHGNHRNTDAYADYDYVRLTKTPKGQSQR